MGGLTQTIALVTPLGGRGAQPIPCGWSPEPTPPGTPHQSLKIVPHPSSHFSAPHNRTPPHTSSICRASPHTSSRPHTASHWVRLCLHHLTPHLTPPHITSHLSNHIAFPVTPYQHQRLTMSPACRAAPLAHLCTPMRFRVNLLCLCPRRPLYTGGSHDAVTTSPSTLPSTSPSPPPPSSSSRRRVGGLVCAILSLHFCRPA